MSDPLPSESLPADEPDNGRIQHLKSASRTIVTSREKMPHSAQWQLALRRTLWRYTQEVLLSKCNRQPRPTSRTEEKNDEQQP